MRRKLWRRTMFCFTEEREMFLCESSGCSLLRNHFHNTMNSKLSGGISLSSSSARSFIPAPHSNFISARLAAAPT